jgi:predicted CXXCH cytochrome family protein
MMRIVALSLGLVACGSVMDVEVSSEPQLVAAHDLAVPLEALLAPTDLAIADDGAIWVLDSGAGLLHGIAADGSRPEPRPVTGAPVGLGWAGGRLWWPHTDLPVLTSLDPRTGEAVDETVPVGDLEEVRLTDVALVADRLVVCDVRGHAWSRPLGGGDWTALPQDLTGSAPFLAAPAGGAWVAVSDVRSYAVGLLDLEGGEYARIGQWGPWEGTFLHPTGLAVDPHGRLFVADGLQGVVQVFDPEGHFLGAVGLDGGILRMDHPVGLAISGDTLYVVDGRRGALLAMTVAEEPTEAGRWLYGRRVPRFSYLREKPGHESRKEAACRSCHDGSLQPAAPVWAMGRYGHPVDKLPEKPIPEGFTLTDDGRIECGTCHIPHRISVEGEVEPAEEVAEVFLRAPRARSMLCTSCHEDAIQEEGSGARKGHLVGEIPARREAGGARALASGIERVECLDCHTPHGAVSESLMRAEVGTGAACARCHVGVGQEQRQRNHPVDQRLADRAAAERLRRDGAFLASGDRVTCLTCHGIHDGQAPGNLSAHLQDAERCTVCHAERARLQGGQHDLQAGADGPVATACQACHAVHDATGPKLCRTAGREGDPTGCLTCHGPGGVARVEVAANRGHPLFEDNDGFRALPSVGAAGALALGTPGRSGCLTCHDPHAAPGEGGGAQLRKPSAGADTCLACHEDKTPAKNSDHDLRGHASAWTRERSESMERGGFCLACHDFHAGRGPDLLQVPPGGNAGENPVSRICLGCHQAEAPAGATVIKAWEHPEELLLTTARVPWHNSGELPLYDPRGKPTDDTQIGRITCLTCHDAHIWSPKQGGVGGAGDGDVRTSFLRQGWEGFCSGCHGEEALEAYKGFHDPRFREKAKTRVQRGDWPIYGEETQ